MTRLPYEIVQNRVSSIREDPHTPGVFWRYHGKWGLHCRGEPLIRDTHFETWSWSGAETMIPTPERITIWYELMREVVYDVPG